MLTYQHGINRYASSKLDIAAQIRVLYPAQWCTTQAGGHHHSGASGVTASGSGIDGAEPLLGVLSVQDTRQDGVYEGT